MSVFKTIADMQKATERENLGPKREFLQVKAGEKFKIRFRQELAQDGSGYSEEAGTGNIVHIHQSPYDFKKKLACTIEDAEFDFRCWAHEQVPVDKRWREKQRFLVNVAVLEDGVWVDKILDQTFSSQHVVSTLIEYAVEYGSITDRDYNISRVGKGANDTQYSLIPLSPGDAHEQIEALEYFDLNTYRRLPYDEQQEFFLAGASELKPAENW